MKHHTGSIHQVLKAKPSNLKEMGHPIRKHGFCRETRLDIVVAPKERSNAQSTIQQTRIVRIKGDETIQEGGVIKKSFSAGLGS